MSSYKGASVRFRPVVFLSSTTNVDIHVEKVKTVQATISHFGATPPNSPPHPPGSLQRRSRMPIAQQLKKANVCARLNVMSQFFHATRMWVSLFRVCRVHFFTCALVFTRLHDSRPRSHVRSFLRGQNRPRRPNPPPSTCESSRIISMTFFSPSLVSAHTPSYPTIPLVSLLL